LEACEYFCPLSDMHVKIYYARVHILSKFTQTYTLYITIHIILHLNMADNLLEKIKTTVTCCAEV